MGALTGFHTDDIVSGWAGIQSWPGDAAAPPTSFPVITNLGRAGFGESGRCDVGRQVVGAGDVGRGGTRVPRSARWHYRQPTVAAAAEASAGGGTGSLFSQMALASMAGRAMAGTTGTGGPGIRERIGAATGKPKNAAQGDSDETPEGPAGGPITGIAAELRELFSLRDAGILTEEEFTEQKQRLLPQ